MKEKYCKLTWQFLSRASLNITKIYKSNTPNGLKSQYTMIAQAIIYLVVW